MSATLTTSEEAQLAQTIEMFEVITQSQPLDYQSLEILKEAYLKLGREKDVIETSKRIAQAYVQLGQLSSAILEYETVLQRFPGDPDVQAALKEIEAKATSFTPSLTPDTSTLPKPADHTPQIKVGAGGKSAPKEFDDGRQSMLKVFVDSKVISPGDFDLCWNTPDLSVPPTGVVEPFIQLLGDKGILPSERSLRILVEKSRHAYLPIEKYDVDMDLARKFPAAVCRRWCVLPFDKMSKTVFVATANPFNRQAAKELAEATQSRLLWYLAPPAEIVKYLRKVFR
jgi:Type II secretion system (T2SS), protein E, N-terminal domain